MCDTPNYSTNVIYIICTNQTGCVYIMYSWSVDTITVNIKLNLILHLDKVNMKLMSDQNNGTQTMGKGREYIENIGSERDNPEEKEIQKSNCHSCPIEGNIYCFIHQIMHYNWKYCCDDLFLVYHKFSKWKHCFSLGQKSHALLFFNSVKFAKSILTDSIIMLYTYGQIGFQCYCTNMLAMKEQMFMVMSTLDKPHNRNVCISWVYIKQYIIEIFSWWHGPNRTTSWRTENVFEWWQWKQWYVLHFYAYNLQSSIMFLNVFL